MAAIIRVMRILGIDPGLSRVGFGLLEIITDREKRTARGQYGPCQWGIISTTKDKAVGERLQEIERDLTELVEQLHPDVVSIERMFFFRNATSL